MGSCSARLCAHAFFGDHLWEGCRESWDPFWFFSFSALLQCAVKTVLLVLGPMFCAPCFRVVLFFQQVKIMPEACGYPTDQQVEPFRKVQASPKRKLLNLITLWVPAKNVLWLYQKLPWRQVTCRTLITDPELVMSKGYAVITNHSRNLDKVCADWPHLVKQLVAPQVFLHRARQAPRMTRLGIYCAVPVCRARKMFFMGWNPKQLVVISHNY